MRLEVANPLTKEMEKYLCEKLGIGQKCIFRTKMPMKLDFIFSVIDKIPASMKRPLMDEPFTPQLSASVADGSVMAQVKKRDILLSYPYESMEPFLQLIKEASKDPDVMTIKITIYRLAKKSRLVEYLCAAAENGKEVTVLIELRARFDEQNNIDWSERMEEAGCRVIYGIEGYKVHSKICLITYRSRNEIRYITQIGTGNDGEDVHRLLIDDRRSGNRRRCGYIFQKYGDRQSERRLSESDRVSDQPEAESVKADGRRDPKRQCGQDHYENEFRDRYGFHPESGGGVESRCESRLDRPGNLLHPAGDSGGDRESESYKYCGTLSGTSAGIRFRNGRRTESVSRICGYDDEKYGKTCGSSVSDL